MSLVVVNPSSIWNWESYCIYQKQLFRQRRYPPLVYNLQVFPVNKVTGAWLPCQHQGGHVPDDLFLLTLGDGREPLLQSQSPLTTEEQQEAYLVEQTGEIVMCAGDGGDETRMNTESMTTRRAGTSNTLVPTTGQRSRLLFWVVWLKCNFTDQTPTWQEKKRKADRKKCWGLWMTEEELVLCFLSHFQES